MGMEFYVLDKDFNALALIDGFQSMIWTDRYWECGDFELYTSATQELVDVLQLDRYLIMNDSPYVMVIEDIRIESDVEEGNHLTVTGRSMESMLDRRIVWAQTNIASSLQDAIKKLITENVITPTDTNRVISIISFEESSEEIVTEPTIKAQYDGEDLYTLISDTCKEAELGFKMIPDSAFNFKFSLYAGADRSYAQVDNPYVIFSPGFENIIDSNYYESKREYKTVCRVSGEGEGTDRKTVTSGDETLTGINRREMYYDGGSISKTAASGSINDKRYEELLRQGGNTELISAKTERQFEGEVEASQLFVYNKDFFLGDVVQLENEYGSSSKARITEIIHSQDDEGYRIYPTFEMLENKSVVPEEYQQVSYIRSTGTQYIDTLYTPNSNTTCTIDFEFDEYEGEQWIISAYRSDSNLFRCGSTSRASAEKKAWNTSGGFAYDIEFSLYARTVGTGSVVGSPNYTAYLFAQNQGSVAHLRGNMKLYECTIRESGIIVRHFIPCYRKTDGVVGLYDIANPGDNAFYTNLGTGDDFSYGRKIY